MLNRQCWQALSCFESHDFVGTWYKGRHNRALNSARTKEITSCFTQGREYFVSAGDAAISVKPLLLYYGVLALVRGVILLSDSRKQEASLKPSHGLEVVDWQKTLAGGISQVLDLQLRATKGTFGELVDSVPNRQPTAWFDKQHNGWGSFSVDSPKPAFANNGAVLTVDDLVSRDHRLLGLYAQTTGRPTKVHLGEAAAGADHIDVSVVATPEVTKMLVQRMAPTGAVVNDRNGTHRLPQVPNFHYRIAAPDLNAAKLLLPATQYTRNDGFFLLEPFPGGDRLSELLRTFLLAYAMGMLVRYYPSKWIALQRNEKGDAAQPLLVAVVAAIEADFPGLILQALG